MRTADAASQDVVRGPSCWPASVERRRRARRMAEPRHMTDTTVDARGARPESLAPAVTRAALILDVLAETGGDAVGPSELARRLGLPKSSIANICGALADAGLVRRIGTGFALGRRLAELGGAYLALGRPGPGVLRRRAPAAGRLRGDGPVRGPRRARGDLPRPPRRPPAGPADVAASGGGCRPSRPRPARRRSRRSPTTSSTGGSTA